MILKKNKPTGIIAGVQKCGTTTLFRSLTHHPDINGAVDPDNNRPLKEVDFFFSEEKWQKGIDWYMSHFVGNSRTFIDASPSYLMERKCYKRIYETLPDVKIIVCLRNPVTRAYSQYNHYKQDMPDSKNWDWRYDKNFLTNLELELADGISFDGDFKGFLLKGAYIYQLEALLKKFKKTQILITVMDKWYYNYQQELQRILLFLDQDFEALPTLHRHYREYTVEPFDIQAQELLKTFYKPLNQQLFDFLGYEITEWNV